MRRKTIFKVFSLILSLTYPRLWFSGQFFQVYLEPMLFFIQFSLICDDLFNRYLVARFHRTLKFSKIGQEIPNTSLTPTSFTLGILLNFGNLLPMHKNEEIIQ